MTEPVFPPGTKGEVRDATGNFLGHEPRDCGEHRTVGAHRAWCYSDGEWCYPDNREDPTKTGRCRGCRAQWLEHRLAVTEAALVCTYTLLQEYGWFPFGYHASLDQPPPELEFWGEGDDGLPFFERTPR